MRSLLPFILVGLGLFTAGCIAYIAWELSSDKPRKPAARPENDSAGDAGQAPAPPDQRR